MKRALIIGVAGQNGYYLAAHHLFRHPRKTITKSDAMFVGFFFDVCIELIDQDTHNTVG